MMTPMIMASRIATIEKVGERKLASPPNPRCQRRRNGWLMSSGLFARCRS